MSEKPNIVFIVADQLRGDCLGIENSAHPVMTPHLDQLALEGVMCKRAYADCPVCMPQRVTMLTGQYASRFGMPYNFMDGEARTPIDLTESLPFRLTREAGYQTKAVGKMHFEPPRARFGFEHITLHPDDYVNWLEDNGYGGFYRGHGLGGNEVYPTVAPMPERYYHSRWIVDEAINFLYQRDPDCPFFLWVVFEAPHSPFDPPEPYDRMYDNFAIPDPVAGDWVNTNQDPRALRRERLVKNADHIRPDVMRELRRRYYGQITHIDYQLGRLFGELKKRGLYDNSLIVFTSDHGEHLGDHGLFAKSTFLESSARVPMIFKPPQDNRQYPPANTLNMPVITADIPATALDFAGLPVSEQSDGVSLRTQLENGDSDRVVFGETTESVFSTDGSLKYIYYPDGGIEHVFDTINDLDDQHNLVGSDDHQAQIAGLRLALVDHLTRFERPFVDQGKLVEYDEDFDEMALRARNPMAWRGPMRYGDGY